MNNSSRLNIPDEIRRIERMLYCHLLHILPEDGTPVIIDKMFRYLNTDSGLLDAIRLNTIFLSPDGRGVILLYANIDYESTGRGADEIEVNDGCFLPTEKQCLKPDSGSIVQLQMLFELVDAAQKMLDANTVVILGYDTAQGRKYEQEVALRDCGQTTNERICVDGTKGLISLLRKNPGLSGQIYVKIKD